jgi:lysozyme
MKKLNILYIVILGSLFSIFLFVIYKFFFVPIGINIDKNIYPITGIDVSEHTGEIDFDKLKNNKVDFVFLKLTEGDNYVDKRFEYNYEGLKKNRVIIGVYHFFRFNKSGISQGNHFLSKIKEKRIELPLVIDIETWGNPSFKEKKSVISEINNFIKLVEKETKKNIFIYTNESGYNNYIKNNFNENDIWICSFNRRPNIEKKWLFWQHSHKGKFDFASGWVDINTYNGNREKWNNFIKKIKNEK